MGDVGVEGGAGDQAPYSAMLHSTFNVMNRWAFVPLLRAGLEPLIGTPIGGHFVLLETIGRSSGLPRHAPLLYAIEDGDVFVVAGFGERTQWYRNLLADPHVRARLPGRRPQAFVASAVEDPARRIELLRRISQNGGLSGYFTGVDPWRASDEALARSVGRVPVVRLRSADGTPIRPGALDPGGWAWLPIQSALLVASLGLIVLLRRAIRRVVTAATAAMR